MVDWSNSSAPEVLPSITTKVEEDELEEDELEEEGEEDMEGEWPLDDALFPATTGTMTCVQLHELVHLGGIDLNPDYQRDVVWTEPKQIGLVDSLWKNLYVPPIILSIRNRDHEDEYRVCIDGKQRLTSIQKFLDGYIFHKTPTGKKVWWTKTPAHKNRTQISDRYKAMFAAKPITVVEFNNLTIEQEREIFQRVQLGVPLTSAEKLQAISSPWALWIRELQKRYIEAEEGLLDVITFETSRAKDFLCLAQLVFSIKSFPKLTQITIPNATKLIKMETGPDISLKKLVGETLETFIVIAGDDRWNSGFKKIEERVSPIEFVMIGVLLARIRNATKEQKAIEIEKLRRDTRTRHSDVRSNSKVFATMREFILRVKVAGVTHYTGGSSSSGKRTTRPRKKRKKNDTSDDDDEDDDYWGD